MKMRVLFPKNKIILTVFFMYGEICLSACDIFISHDRKIFLTKPAQTIIIIINTDEFFFEYYMLVHSSKVSFLYDGYSVIEKMKTYTKMSVNMLYLHKSIS